MNKTFLGLGLIILSVAAFFMWINPHYANVKTLQTQLSESKDALAQAQELDAKRSALVEKENSLKPDDLTKLQKLLPDSVDSIRFVVEMQGIAARNGISIQEVSIGDNVANSKSSGQQQGVGPSTKQYSETQLGFSVSTTYENLIAYLNDLEKSLRIVEVRSLEFNVDSKRPDTYKVTMTVGTYWLNKKSATSVTSS